MQLSIEQQADVHVVRLKDARMTYPGLAAFFGAVRQLVEQGARKLLFDFASVSYLDSASIGCLMDIHRLLREHGGAMTLVALQPRVETMLSMTGVHKIINIQRDEQMALAAFAPEA